VKAHYVLLNIEASQDVLNELVDTFRFNDAVLRHLTVNMTAAVTEPSPMMRQEKARPAFGDQPRQAPESQPAGQPGA